MSQDIHAQRILILDFGSQYTQLIARRVREIGVFSEIRAWDMDEAEIREYNPTGIILAGGPESVTEEGSPRAPEVVFNMGLPVLGICYGQQTMCAQLGGRVERSDHREFGRAQVEISESCALFDGDVSETWKAGAREQVWMSHGDRVIELPPGFRVVGKSGGAPFAIIADDERRYYGTMFHPEVVHTSSGAELLKAFTHGVVGCG